MATTPSKTKVGVWSLGDNDHDEKPPPKNTESLFPPGGSPESVIGADGRSLVPDADFKPGGYSGTASINDPDVQFRTAKTVATTQAWLIDTSDGREKGDVAFIEVQTPFVDVTPIQYKATPQKDALRLGVVGYPGDRGNQGEGGARMYEMYYDVEHQYDLGSTWHNMLQYDVDTYGGNSGSPVFYKRPTSAKDAVAIGVHVYGASPNNYASVIGPEGNVFEEYIEAISAYNTAGPVEGIVKTPLPSDPNITLVEVPSSTGSGPDPSPDPPSGPSKPGDGSGTETGGANDGPGTFGGQFTGVEKLDESFWSDLTRGIQGAIPFASQVLQAGLPIALGPLGIPAGALAGVALNAAGQLMAHATGTESILAETYTYQGVAECSILREASIAGLTYLGNEKCLEEGIFDTMADIMKNIAPTVKAVAPKLLDAVAEPLLRLAIHKLNEGTEAGSDPPPIRDTREDEANTKGFGPPLAENQKHFVAALSKALEEADASRFSGYLTTESTAGTVVNKGLSNVAPFVGSAAHRGLQRAVSGTEDYMTDKFAFDGLAERSAVGECALRALVSMDATQQSRVLTEGFFDAMVDVIARYGPAIIKTAPAVIGALQPIVTGLEAGKTLLPLPTGSTELQAGDASIPWPKFTEDGIEQVRRGQGGSDMVSRIAELATGSAQIYIDGTDGYLQQLSDQTIIYLGSVYYQSLPAGMLPPTLDPWTNIFGPIPQRPEDAQIVFPVPWQDCHRWLYQCIISPNGQGRVWPSGVRLQDPAGHVVEVPTQNYLYILTTMMNNFTLNALMRDPSQSFGFTPPYTFWPAGAA
ncbi:hypothetical protein SLS62_009942 [Diatrype stigma]|uniref:Uncharacterized protein n=1 Tax=Diatrype stigma TaxID=117547 RepID=A0AAN9YHK6_9PEZI